MAMALRELSDADLEEVFRWEQHSAAVQMAAFTRPDPSDRRSFDDHYRRIRTDPSVMLRAIDDAGVFVGTIGSFWVDGDREVTYWIDPARWGRGIASAALAAYLQLETTRPLFGRVAQHNIGSARVLTRAGFVRVDVATSFAAGVQRDVVEFVYRLGQLRDS